MNSLTLYFLDVAEKHGIDFSDPDGAFIDGPAVHEAEWRASGRTTEPPPGPGQLPTCWGRVRVVRETAKALLVEGADGTTWVPKSAVRGLAKLGDEGELEVADWWAPAWNKEGAKP